MKKVLFVLMFLLIAPVCASAVTYNFDNAGNIDPYDGDGINKAVMTVDVAGSILTVTIDNTSPAWNDDDPPELNSPGITGFGFDFDLGGLEMPAPLGWTLEAQKYDDNTMLFVDSALGSNTDTSNWGFSTTGIQSMNFLNFATRTVHGMNYGLYNPDIVTSGANLNNNFKFTLATLTMTLPNDVANDGYFDIISGLTDTPGDEYQYDVWVRLQSTDSDREGSAKLEGIRDDGTVFIPEPSAMILILLGIAGVLASRRKKY